MHGIAKRTQRARRSDSAALRGWYDQALTYWPNGLNSGVYRRTAVALERVQRDDRRMARVGRHRRDAVTVARRGIL